MTARTKAPFRADHVGSLLRPAPLKEARAKHGKGEIGADALKAVEDREIEKAIKKQEEVGLKVATDGEFRRAWWQFDFYKGLDGVELYELDHGIQFHGVQTKAHAIWTFSGVTKEKYPNGLPLELNLRVFRTFKGDIERGVLGELVILNPNPDAPVKRSGPIVFESKEFVADRRIIPRELNSEIGGAAGAGKVDLFADLVDNKQVQVELRCVDPAQYFGVAEPDVYLRPGDASFELNFGKAYLSIWLQMLLVTGFGVTFSTFLSGPVALMASISAIVLGFFGQFVRDIAMGTQYGGGPIESFIRIIIQQNVMTDLEMNTIVTKIIKGMDAILMHVLQAATYILPDYTQFDTTEFVASGYNIFASVVGQQLVMALVYFTAVSIAGYFFLKTREIAA